MQDLTTGSLSRHLLKTTSFMLVMMVFQTLYFLIDLYWVGRLGTDAVAAVGIAGNLSFLVLALTQMLGVGTTAVVSHAAGRKDHEQARVLFNQSQVLAMVIGFVFLIVGLIALWPYARAMSPDANTARLATDYLLWFIPAMGLQFAMVAMGAALRGVGNFKPGMIVSTVTVAINMILAPILIFGWGTGRAFGVTGAAISTFIAVIIGVVWLSRYFVGKAAYLHFDTSTWKPKVDVWRRILGIGMPTGFEFAVVSVYLVLVYSIARPFGADAQAGFGIGQRIIQAGFMPVVALGFAVAPVAGQNFGARLPERVKATFKDAALMASGVMILFAVICYIVPDAMVRVFTRDPEATAIGVEYLRIIAWNYLGSGLIFVSSSMFQAMGNTIPSLITSAVRIAIIVIPAVILARMPGFQLRWLWYLSASATYVQLALSLLLLRREFVRRLTFEPQPA